MSTHYNVVYLDIFFFFSSRRRHTRSKRDWSSDVCSSDLVEHKRQIKKPFMPLAAHIIMQIDNPAGTGFSQCEKPAPVGIIARIINQYVEAGMSGQALVLSRCRSGNRLLLYWRQTDKLLALGQAEKAAHPCGKSLW